MSTTGKSVQVCMFRIIFYQLLIIMGVVLLELLLQGIKNSASMLGGALAYYLPTAIFVWRLSLKTGARMVMRFLMTFWMGEMVKLALSGLLFVLIVRYLPVDLLFAVLGLVTGIVAFWIASVRVGFKPGIAS